MITFGKDNLRMLRGDIADALKAVEEKHGVKFELGRISYDPNSFRGTLTAIIPGAEGSNKYEVEWNKHFYRYGFAQGDLGRKFRTGENVYEIIGLKKANRKYPIIAKRVPDGKQFKFTPHVVRVGLGGVL